MLVDQGLKVGFLDWLIKHFWLVVLTIRGNKIAFSDV